MEAIARGRRGTSAPSELLAAPDLAAGLLGERSVPAIDGRAPSADELLLILEAAAAVPDHGRVRPWRFVVVAGESRTRFADALEADSCRDDPDAPPAVRAKARSKAFAAPAMVVVVASLDPASRIPRWEQAVSASCTGYAIVLAAHALGLGAIWRSTSPCNGTAIRALTGCADREELLGWILLGSKSEPSRRAPRQPFDPQSCVTFA